MYWLQVMPSFVQEMGRVFATMASNEMIEGLEARTVLVMQQGCNELEGTPLSSGQSQATLPSTAACNGGGPSILAAGSGATSSGSNVAETAAAHKAAAARGSSGSSSSSVGHSGRASVSTEPPGGGSGLDDTIPMSQEAGAAVEAACAGLTPLLTSFADAGMQEGTPEVYAALTLFFHTAAVDQAGSGSSSGSSNSSGSGGSLSMTRPADVTDIDSLRKQLERVAAPWHLHPDTPFAHGMAENVVTTVVKVTERLVQAMRLGTPQYCLLLDAAYRAGG